MTEDDIIRMAREAGYPPWLVSLHDELESFAKLVAAAEREECAKVCEEQEQRSRESSEKSKRERDQFMYHHCAVTARWNAAAIRARGQAWLIT